MADLNKIIDELSKLTVVEASELSKQLEDKWGVTAAAPVAAAAAPGAAPAEEKSELGKINSSSYGTGVRLIGGSGNVYSFEASTGNEGPEILLIFQYPWSGETG